MAMLVFPAVWDWYVRWREALFLTPVWEDVHADLQSADPRRAWAAFERAKVACQGCHTAERVPFMNDQPVFDLAAPAASARP